MFNINKFFTKKSKKMNGDLKTVKAFGFTQIQKIHTAQRVSDGSVPINEFEHLQSVVFCHFAPEKEGDFFNLIRRTLAEKPELENQKVVNDYLEVQKWRPINRFEKVVDLSHEPFFAIHLDSKGRFFIKVSGVGTVWGKKEVVTVAKPCNILDSKEIVDYAMTANYVNWNGFNFTNPKPQWYKDATAQIAKEKELIG